MKVEVPVEAQQQIQAAVEEMNAAWTRFKDCRSTFVTLVSATHKALNLDPEKMWDIAPDASHFEEVSAIPEGAFLVADNTPALEELVAKITPENQHGGKGTQHVPECEGGDCYICND